jgi:hypothetical protein
LFCGLCGDRRPAVEKPFGFCLISGLVRETTDRPVKALLLLRFCRHAIRGMLFGATARFLSIPHRPLRILALAEPTEFSLGFLADFRSAIPQ